MFISRRKFPLLSGAALLAACAPAPAKARKDDADVLILGSGLSRFQAVRMLTASGMKVLIPEAAPGPADLS